MTLARLLSTYTIIGASLAAASPALALEPLDVFLDSAKGASFDAREIDATVAQREREVTQAWLKLAPTASAVGIYKRNQFEVLAPPPRSGAIVPQDQLDLTIGVSVPLVDVGSWERIGAANRVADAARAQRDQTQSELRQVIARDYYQVVAAEAVLAAAQNRLDVAEKSRDRMKDRASADLANVLDLRRAEAEVDRAKQDVADAAYGASAARRVLGTASGHAPSAGSIDLPDSLEPEAPLASWEGTSIDALPAVRRTDADAKAAARTAQATVFGLLPVITADASERFTNAVGFTVSPAYTLSLTATFRFDSSLFAAGAAQRSAADAALVRKERARTAALDAIRDAWQQIERQLEKTRAAKSEEATLELAAKLAQDRYQAGTATYLDVLSAQRDAFGARVRRIQASADLAYARIALRVAADRPLAAGPSALGGSR